MKAIFVRAVLAATTALAASTAGAQGAPTDRPVTVGFAVGYQFLRGSFENTVGATPRATIDLHVQVPLAPRRLALRGDAMWMGLLGAAGNVLFAPSGGGGFQINNGNAPKHVIAWSADIVARLRDPSKDWSPYVLAGVGLYTSAGDRNFPPARTGLQAGVGLEGRVGVTSVAFVEYRYLGMGTGTVAPLTVGMRF